MFTFIRLALTNALSGTRHIDIDHVDEISPRDDVQQGNPWRQELDRLANCPDGLTGTSRRPSGSYLPKPQAVPRKLPPKAGTITDLKVWWGKAITTYRPPTNVDVTNFAPPPERKRNHWSI